MPERTPASNAAVQSIIRGSFPRTGSNSNMDYSNNIHINARNSSSSSRRCRGDKGSGSVVVVVVVVVIVIAVVVEAAAVVVAVVYWP